MGKKVESKKNKVIHKIGFVYKQLHHLQYFAMYGMNADIKVKCLEHSKAPWGNSHIIVLVRNETFKHHSTCLAQSILYISWNILLSFSFLLLPAFLNEIFYYIINFS